MLWHMPIASASGWSCAPSRCGLPRRLFDF